jgi:hypothetical protein
MLFTTLRAILLIGFPDDPSSNDDQVPFITGFPVRWIGFDAIGERNGTVDRKKGTARIKVG